MISYVVRPRTNVLARSRTQGITSPTCLTLLSKLNKELSEVMICVCHASFTVFIWRSIYIRKRILCACTGTRKQCWIISERDYFWHFDELELKREIFLLAFVFATRINPHKSCVFYDNNATTVINNQDICHFHLVEIYLSGKRVQSLYLADVR